MPTFVSLASASTAQLPMSLAIFSAVIFVIYLIGALSIPETRGNFSLMVPGAASQGAGIGRYQHGACGSVDAVQSKAESTNKDSSCPLTARIALDLPVDPGSGFE